MIKAHDLVHQNLMDTFEKSVVSREKKWCSEFKCETYRGGGVSIIVTIQEIVKNNFVLGSMGLKIQDYYNVVNNMQSQIDSMKHLQSPLKSIQTRNVFFL